jgi:hypothetical protein
MKKRRRSRRRIMDQEKNAKKIRLTPSTNVLTKLFVHHHYDGHDMSERRSNRVKIRP